MEITIKIKTETEFIDPPVFNNRKDAIEWLEAADYLDEQTRLANELLKELN